MPEKKLSKTFLEVLDNTATKDDVKELMLALKELIADLRSATSQETASNKAEMAEQVSQVIQSFNDLIPQVEHTKSTTESEIRTLTRMLRQEVDRLQDAIETVRTEIPDMPTMPDLTPIDRKIAEVETKIPQLTPEKVRDLLLEAEPLPTDSIDGLDDLIKKRVQIAPPGGRSLFSPAGFHLYTNGTKRGRANYLNLIPGTNVTISYSHAHGRNDVTINATGGGEGGGLSVLAATGTVDDSNTEFTFASEPTLVVVNGTSYRHGHGVTIATTTATLDNAPGVGGDVYGLG